MGPSGAAAGWAEAWQASWDRLEEALVPDRERQVGVLVDVVEAMAGTTPTVVDLACGTGTVTRRLLDRLPGARSIALDVDPVLLTIASAAFAGDGRVQVVRADLRDPGWGRALPADRVDAVVTANALHWLPEVAVRRLYRDLARRARPGGVVAHSERMPLDELPRLGPALAAVGRGHGPDRARALWDAWWGRAASEPALRSATAQRVAVFETTYPAVEFSPPASWHVGALTEAGFAEAGVVWRAGEAAVVAAVR